MTGTRRILVTGSRDWNDFRAIVEALRPYRRAGAVLVHGDARGADRMAAAIWRTWGLPVEAHRADWNTHGKRAGYVRNTDMITAGADVCLAFIRNNSRGATHCASSAEAAGIPTRRQHVNDNTNNSDLEEDLGRCPAHDRDETRDRQPLEQGWTLFDSYAGE